MTYRNPWAKPHEPQVFETKETPMMFGNGCSKNTATFEDC